MEKHRVIPALCRWTQKNQEVKVRQGYVKPYLEKVEQGWEMLSGQRSYYTSMRIRVQIPISMQIFRLCHTPVSPTLWTPCSLGGSVSEELRWRMLEKGTHPSPLSPGLVHGYTNTHTVYIHHTHIQKTLILYAHVNTHAYTHTHIVHILFSFS